MEKEKNNLIQAPIRKWKGITFRSAKISDISEIVNLEKTVWKKSAAPYEQIESRIKKFQRGNFVAIFNDKIVSYCAIEYVDNLINKYFSWNEVTDNGYTINSHNENKNYVYGINLSVHHSMNGYKLGNMMVFYGFLIVIEDNKKGVFIGSRLPGFAAYKKNNPYISAEEYADLRRNGKRRDYELKMYESEGFELIKVMPNYFDDPSSLNYGALVYWKNPYYGNDNLSELVNNLWLKTD